VAAVVLGVVVLGLCAVSVLVDRLTHQSGTGGPAADAFFTAVGAVPATAVGMLLAARRPRNPIGWILLAIIILDISPTSPYLILDYRTHHGTLPLGGAAVVIEDARGEYRQQLKWLYSGAGIWVLSLIFGVFIAQLVAGNAPGWGNQAVVGAIVLLGTAALPVCMGVAVLKYRLYELNRVISRVVSYTVITALLGGLFAGLILLATHVLPVKGPVALAVATLVIAALFNPLRRRVQHGVDRRFNRERYDAETVVAAFTGRLRQIIDLDTVREDLVGVVHEAFQPAHVSVLLPGTGPNAAVPAPARPGGGQPGDNSNSKLAQASLPGSASHLTEYMPGYPGAGDRVVRLEK